ncbi:MAG: hypothetical protein QW568_04905 [Candidatus Anstonellaceae archaeon]
MASADSVLSEKGEVHSLAKRKQGIVETLIAAGGQDFSFLLEMCNDLSDIIDDMGEIRMKIHEKEHAAFDAKVKFSRKMRRKAKDLRLFEEELLREFDQKHISLEYGRKLGEIVKLLKSNDVEKAREQAEEFYSLQEMGVQLEIINEALLKKKVRIERAKRDAESLLFDLDWLEKEPAPDLEKAHRHEQRRHLFENLQRIRINHIEALKSMPLPELLAKAEGSGLERFGFPRISNAEASSLASFLRKNRLETKTAAQLIELAEQSEQKLRHMLADLAEFRREVVGRKAFFEQVESLHAGSFLEMHSAASPVLAYLSGEYAEAKEAAEWLFELEKTAGEDAKEWERMRLIEEKKTKLAGTERAALLETVRELEALEKIVEGKAQPEPVKDARKKEGIIDNILGFFR